MTFNIITFGCKVNQCESEDIKKIMLCSGFEFIPQYDYAEIVIINSCSVTGESDRKLRQTIHKIKRTNKNCILVLMGCMPQAEPDIAQRLGEVDILLGNSNKNKIQEVIKEYLVNKKTIFRVEPIKNVVKFESKITNHSQNRSRAFLKIEDGCNRFCSYCIIPYARGRVRSKPIEEIQEDARIIAENGYKEIVLVGINLSSYGMDLGCTLADAVRAVAKISGITRIRLGSLEPDLMTDSLINELSYEKKLCPQFHLSLQSGSDEILQKMKRRYTRNDYLEVTNKLRKKFTYATFTTDIMVGFPGETEKDFDDTLRIIEEVKFLKVHTFPYSPRPNTPAAAMSNQISRSVKSERVKKVIEKSDECCKMILNGFEGKFMDVLYETVDDSGMYEGYTSNYIPVKTVFTKDIRGKIVSTFLSSTQKNFIEGLFKQPIRE